MELTSVTEPAIDTSPIFSAQLNKFLFNQLTETEYLSEVLCFCNQKWKIGVSRICELFTLVQNLSRRWLCLYFMCNISVSFLFLSFVDPLHNF
jgi:uncharacterized membrane protein (DUF106 family)